MTNGKWKDSDSCSYERSQYGVEPYAQWCEVVQLCARAFSDVRVRSSTNANPALHVVTTTSGSHTNKRSDTCKVITSQGNGDD